MIKGGIIQQIIPWDGVIAIPTNIQLTEIGDIAIPTDIQLTEIGLPVKSNLLSAPLNVKL